MDTGARKLSLGEGKFTVRLQEIFARATEVWEE
jgi:hypothetical protein